MKSDRFRSRSSPGSAIVKSAGVLDDEAMILINMLPDETNTSRTQQYNSPICSDDSPADWRSSI